MARIRSIKPEFWTDRKLARLPRDVRLLYIALWNQADEWGRVHGDARYVKGHCLPYDDDLSLPDIEAMLDVLERHGRVQQYAVDGDPFLFVVKLAAHQRLEPAKVPSRLPEPPSPQVTAMSEPRADKSARRADECAPRADTSERIVALQVAGGREQVAGGRGQVAPAAPAATGDMELVRPAGAAAVVAAYVDAITDLGSVLDARAKGRIARDAAALLNERPPAPLELLVIAAQRLAANGFADLGTEARKVAAERRGANKPSTTDARVAATLATANRLRSQEQTA